MCYYVGDIIKFQNFNSDNISIDEKPHENISIFDISYEKKNWSKTYVYLVQQNRWIY